MLTVGSLFAGIGGFDLGFERAGMRTVWQVEQSEFCRRVLERHFPDAERYEDVRAVGRNELAWVDVICGGFPCQDISVAGRGAGIDGEQSGLWSEMFRIACELRPRYVVIENVPALLARGLDRVLADLASGGFDAEWDCLPASAFGAPHRRDRIWIVAYPGSPGRREDAGGAVGDEGADEGWPAQDHHFPERDGEGSRAGHVADTPGNGREPRRPEPAGLEGTPGTFGSGRWFPEPGVGRVVAGLPNRVDRVNALGNALVPQVAEWIGRRILEWEAVTC